VTTTRGRPPSLKQPPHTHLARVLTSYGSSLRSSLVFSLLSSLSYVTCFNTISTHSRSSSFLAQHFLAQHLARVVMLLVVNATLFHANDDRLLRRFQRRLGPYQTRHRRKTHLTVCSSEMGLVDLLH